MEEKERREKLKTQTEEVYAAIGRFSVKFEHVCHAMSITIVAALQANGLQKQKLGQAVVAGLTADPLRRMLGAVLAEVRSNDEQDKQIIKDVLNRVQKLTVSRNNIIHRTWFVGWSSSQDENLPPTFGLKVENTNKGAEFRPERFTVAEFDRLSSEADELARIIGRMPFSLFLGKHYWEELE